MTEINNTAIKIEGLDFSYGYGKKELDNISCEILKGKIVALLGRNGAGKTTLFLTINGINKPQIGSISINGKKVGYTKKENAEIKKKVGIVFQNPDIQLVCADVKSDVCYGLLNLGYEKEEAEKKAMKTMKNVGIEHLAHRPIHTLSFGEKKRTAIAGILAMEPEIILLDEPTAGLDPSGVTEIMKFIRCMRDEMGLTIVLATHDIDMVPIYCDFGIVMDKGKIVKSGTMERIFEDKELLRNSGLRTTRIGHLMEVLKTKDKIDVSERAQTISQARKEIKRIHMNEIGG